MPFLFHLSSFFDAVPYDSDMLSFLVVNLFRMIDIFQLKKLILNWCMENMHLCWIDFNIISYDDCGELRETIVEIILDLI